MLRSLLRHGEEVKQMNEKQRKIVEDNLPIVKHAINKYFPVFKADEDAYQIGSMALIAAVSSFDEARKCTLSTYAVRFILFELNHYYRKNKDKYKYVVQSIDEVVNKNSTEKDITLHDLSSAQEDSYEDLINRIALEEALDQLPEEHKRIVKMYYMNGMKQEEIGNVIGISQVRVGRILKRSYKKMRMFLENVA